MNDISERPAAVGVLWNVSVVQPLKAAEQDLAKSPPDLSAAAARLDPVRTFVGAVTDAFGARGDRLRERDMAVLANDIRITHICLESHTQPQPIARVTEAVERSADAAQKPDRAVFTEPLDPDVNASWQPDVVDPLRSAAAHLKQANPDARAADDLLVGVCMKLDELGNKLKQKGKMLEERDATSVYNAAVGNHVALEPHHTGVNPSVDDVRSYLSGNVTHATADRVALTDDVVNAVSSESEFSAAMTGDGESDILLSIL